MKRKSGDTGKGSARAVRSQTLQAAPAKELVEIRDCMLRIEGMLVAHRDRTQIEFTIPDGEIAEFVRMRVLPELDRISQSRHGLGW